MKKAVVGILTTLPQAERAVAALQRRGFEANDISVLFPDRRSTKEFAHEHDTKAPEGAAVGASAGGLAGGSIGLLAGLGLLAIPGLGPFIAAGPIAATLSGLVAGAAAGGVAGALVGLGIPEDEARVYESKLRGGNILVAVHTEDAEARKRAQAILQSAGAQDVSTVRETAERRDSRNP